MKRFATVVASLLVSLGLLASAQDANQPATTQTAEDTAMIRLIDLSPNAASISLRLEGTREGGAVVSTDQMSNLAYQDVTEYMEVPAGEYTATLSAEGSADLEQTVTFGAQNAYTVAVIGLVLPGEDVTAEDQGGDFFTWLEGLFGGDTERRDALALQLVVVQDDLNRVVREGQTVLRAVHASPGTDAIDIAFDGERGSVIGDLSYGETSRYREVDLSEGTGNLVVRIAGSQAVALDLDEAQFEPNTINTIYLAGTSLEETPLEAIIVSQPAVTDTEAQAAPATPAPATPENEAAGQANQAGQENQAQENQTVVDVILANPDLSTFATLLGQAGLTDTLTGGGPYTVFAPNNDAFAALPQDQIDALNSDPEMLRNVLMNHVYEGELRSGDLSPDQPIATMQGGELTVGDDGTLAGATVTEADLEATNGVVHVIDRVLLPEGMANGQ